MIRKILSPALAFAGALALAACGGTPAPTGTVVALVPAQEFNGVKVEVASYSPQVFYAGRGYSLTASLYDSGVGMDVLELPLVHQEVKLAANAYCNLRDTYVVGPVDFTDALPGTQAYRIYFNCAAPALEG